VLSGLPSRQRLDLDDYRAGWASKPIEFGTRRDVLDRWIAEDPFLDEPLVQGRSTGMYACTETETPGGALRRQNPVGSSSEVAAGDKDRRCSRLGDTGPAEGAGGPQGTLETSASLRLGLSSNRSGRGALRAHHARPFVGASRQKVARRAQKARIHALRNGPRSKSGRMKSSRASCW
jgi:hypothetical protein